jgi:hypothetical protein
MINDTYSKLVTAKIYHPDTNNNKDASMTKTCFLHLLFHPKDPKSSHIQQIFQEEMLAPPQMQHTLPQLRNHKHTPLGTKILVIASHCTSNIGNLLSPRIIRNEDGPLVSYY